MANYSDIQNLLNRYSSYALDDETDRRCLTLLLAELCGDPYYSSYNCIAVIRHKTCTHKTERFDSALQWCQEQASNIEASVSVVGVDPLNLESTPLATWNS